MARSSFVRRPLLRQGQKRQPLWIGLGVDPLALPASAKVLAGILNAAALALRPFTIVRTRLLFHVESDQLIASEQTQGALGIIVVSDQAVAAGAASVPGPITNTDAPFFVWEPFINSFLFLTGSGVQEPTGTYITVDSKAMRKVNNNEDVAIMFENAAALGCNVSMEGRMLVKLH